MATSTRKRKRNRTEISRQALLRAARRNQVQRSGVIVELNGQYGSEVKIRNGNLDTIASKLNTGAKKGVLVQIGNKWVNPKAVVSVQKGTWTEYRNG